MIPSQGNTSFFPPVSDRYRNVGRLLISCPDRPGIVAAVSKFLFDNGANIIHSNQHSTDPAGGTFFMRIEYYHSEMEARKIELQESFASVADSFGMLWRMEDAGRPKRLAVFVSKADHALFELLWRRRAGDLRADIAMVLSNHPDLEPTVSGWGVPFHHIPITKNRKQEAEARQLALLEGKVDAVVFARYMQIAGAGFINRYPGRIINIHHSFLPAFIGADTYTQAYERGVKLIGATAHYVTEALDAGPIIEQDIERVDHRHSVEDMKRIGRYIERVVLARAVSWHVEDRILVHGNKTVVFS
jgi:formyltetrahydrofolate deformylase